MSNNWYIGWLIVSFQFFIALYYYTPFHHDKMDERWSWRMFSENTMIESKLYAFTITEVGKHNASRQIDLESYIGNSWLFVMKQGTDVMLRKMSEYLCRTIETNYTVYVYNAVFLDGSMISKKDGIKCN